MITPSGTTSYLVNAMGQRVYKSGAGYYAYDNGGRLIGEYNPDGSVIQEYVYIGGRLAAILRDSGVYYVYPDHLGAPRLVTDASGNVVWTWETEPFGTAAPNEDPNATGRTFALNIRFPGQYYDKETNLHYNHFRYYDPTAGRYIESDPIGLGGGLNTYAYVGGNPVGSVDPFGLKEEKPSWWEVFKKNSKYDPQQCSKRQPTFSTCMACCQAEAQSCKDLATGGDGCRIYCIDTPYSDNPFKYVLVKAD